MNRLTIIGNVCSTVELRTTPAGKSVCNFTVAVNRRNKAEGQPDADFFRVSAWNQLGENCGKYLAKGRKVAVVGSVSVRTYETQAGKHGATLEVVAQEVEFLSGRQDNVDQKTGMEKVDPADNPFNQQTVDELPY